MENILEKEVLDVIKENYECFFSAERKVADYILQNPGIAVNSNVSELAKLSGVSDATVVRMCHHTGYSGYYQFRISLARDLGKKEIGKETSTENDNELDKIFRRYAEKIIECGKRIGTEDIRRCISIIRNAQVVHILATGNTANVAQYMGFRLGRVGIRTTYNIAPEFCLNHINLADEHDALVAISKSGSSKQVLAGVKRAKEKKIPVISITASAQSPIAEISDCILLSSRKQEDFIVAKRYSYLNEIAIIDAVVDLTRNEEKINTTEADKPELLLSESKI